MAGMLNGTLEGLGTGAEELVPGRDLFTVATYMVPIDAHLACGCLVAAGVPAVVADVNHGQADHMLLPAMGGVRVQAPQEYLAQAREVLAAFDRGDYALDDDTDVGTHTE